MARLARLYVPGMPQLVVQRGINRQVLFNDPADFQAFRLWLRDAAREHGVALHAYVLMPDHFHLLATPPDERATGRMLQSVGRRYVAYFNRRNVRTGTLWEGRYRSTVVDPARYLIAVMRYLELNPVRAGLAAEAAKYPWSSCAHHVGIAPDLLITDHAVYWALGNTPFERQAQYRQALDEPLVAPVLARIRAAGHKGWMLGDQDFIAAQAPNASRRPAIAARGRPARSLA